MPTLLLLVAGVCAKAMRRSCQQLGSAAAGQWHVRHVLLQHSSLLLSSNYSYKMHSLAYSFAALLHFAATHLRRQAVTRCHAMILAYTTNMFIATLQQERRLVPFIGPIYEKVCLFKLQTVHQSSSISTDVALLCMYVYMQPV
jgi:hypothetical protein